MVLFLKKFILFTRKKKSHQRILSYTTVFRIDRMISEDYVTLKTGVKTHTHHGNK